MSLDLTVWRSEFPILAACSYLINNSLGAMPARVYDALRAYADSWAALGVRAWGTPHADQPSWFELKGAVGDKIAPLMGAPAGSVLMHENASLANSILLSALDWDVPGRDKVVCTDQDFPSDVYTLRAMLPAHYHLEVVRSHNGMTIDPDALLTAIDERTRLVSISHVLFRSAYILPLRQIVEKAHAVGAQVLANGYHSVGIIPVDVTADAVDFYVGGTLKWLCGGPGGVFMYVRPDLLKTLKPRITGWFAHQRPFTFDFEALDLREDRYRLANGTPPIAALYSVQPGVEIIAEVGVATIRANSIRQTELLIALADAIGCTVFSPRDAAVRGGTVTLQPPHAYEVSREMLARQIVIDYREGAGIRIAPHFYNTDDEIRGAVDAIADILASGAWQRHTRRDFVT
jgi:kynureninase